MKFEPILKRKIKNFADSFGYTKLDDNSIFERFINNLIISMYQPDATSKNSSLLEISSVGGQNDMGIDGIAIKVNGVFVTTTQEIDSIIDYNHTISVEFIFIQSKFKDKTDSGEFAKFADGVYDFLCDAHYEPHNDKIESLITLKNYIFSDAIMPTWKDAPIVRTFYVIFGEWNENVHIDAKVKSLEEKIYKLNDYGKVSHKNYGASDINTIYDENQNNFNTVINVLGTLEFEEVSGISNSQAILCSAEEFSKLLVTKEGEIRKTLFTDNVRDYQGNTQINQNMLTTIENDPKLFLLLNNGITIVCNKLVSSNRKITITDPQIVNGCQTSNVIYAAYKANIDLKDVFLLVKIIATEESRITNEIVRGTNSQNPVFSETFEITREFHKHLEEFIDSIQVDITKADDKIYYERRSKQYETNLLVKKYRTFSMDTLAHSTLSCFMQAPHDSVLHIVHLLNKYRNSIFVDNQSFYPYYISALLCLNFERLMLEEVIEKKYDTYKYFIIAIIVELINKGPADINHRNIIDVCDKIKLIALSESDFIDVVQKAIDIFESTKDFWIKKQGSQYRHGIKDNPTFTKFLFTKMRGGNIDKIDLSENEAPTMRGRVLSAKQDRAGRYYGFIIATPDNVFFHSEDNPRIDFSRIVGKTVTYTITTNPINGKLKAINVHVID